MTDVVEAPAAEETTSRRGRPRPSATIERDQRVLAALATEGSTRDEIVTKVNEGLGEDDPNRLTPARVYLSLYRLRKDGLVERARNGAAHRWARVEATEPVPVAG